MAKVFRFHEGSNIQGWETSTPLNNKAIAAIKDPNGANAEHEITSIPSPLARIDLIKTAFKEVSNIGMIGKTIFHKMVSDALDVGQIFYNSDKYKDKIEILSWDKTTDLNNLLQSNNSQHKLLGESLRLFLNQDAITYNFGLLNKFYLINYKKGRNTLNVIGGTSPATLFFTSANHFNLEGFQEEGDTMLDDDYKALQERDPEYIKYLYALRKSVPNFATLMPEVDHYFDQTFSNLPDQLRNNINNFNAGTINDYSNLTIDGGGQKVEVFDGVFLRKAMDKTALITNSDFVINAEKPSLQGALPPLVLPNETFNTTLTYVTAPWSPYEKVPHLEKAQLHNRRLPADGNKYPYLTISDFLEPVIIRTEFLIDKSSFQDAGYKGDKGFMLPLKQKYFEYFSPETLEGSINGEKRFELKSLANGSVQAVLRIPIQQNSHITYRRTYYNPVNPTNKPEYDEVKNKGAVVENRLNLGLTPFYKFPEDIFTEYNIALYDADKNPLFDKNEISLNFIDKNNREIKINPPIQRRKKVEENLNMWAYTVNENFSYMVYKHKFGQGLLIPAFKKLSPGIDKFTFAIDFGTTNTHIEYAVNEGHSLPFELLAVDKDHYGQLINSNKYDEVYLKRCKDDLIPHEIGKSSEYNLPQRTSVAYHQSTNFGQPLISMGNITIPFKYEKASFDRFTEVKTNLKWNTENNSHFLMQKFFEQIVKMIRNKILLNNGDLEKTEVIWSYPASMSTGRLNRIESQLHKTITEYLGKVTVDKVCESLTPFYYYVFEEGKSSLIRPTVSVDIGGGTSDVAVYKENVPVLFTSYRFAGDAIFGDNYNRNIKINGFVQKYYDRFLDILETNNETSLNGIIQSIKERNNSNDAINALFSLEDNSQLKEKKIRISFLDQLKNDNEFKIIFLLFFMANIYHIARIFKVRNLDVPAQFAFSGTASKLLSILDDSESKHILQDLIRHTFRDVLGQEDIGPIEILWAKKPKELSSKGGLHIRKADNTNVKNIKEVLVAADVTASDEPELSYSNLNGIETKSLNEFDEFLDFFFGLDKKVSYKDLFEIEQETLEYVREMLDSRKENTLKVGIQEKLRQIGGNKNSPIDETLFFYPLTGSLGEIAYSLYKK